MVQLAQITSRVATAALLAASAISIAAGCSDFVLNASSASSGVTARTMDFAVDLTTVVEVIPRDTVLQEPPAFECADCADVHWQVKHGFVAMNVMGFNVAIDGMNEHGLSAAWLMVNNTEQIVPADLSAAKEETGIPVISSLCTYLLGNFATVEEVRQGLNDLQIAPLDAYAVFRDRRLQHAPLHVSVHDAQHQSLVIELLDGHIKIYENASEVLTNSPPLEQQRQALLDNGFDQIPGGYSSTERFVRLSVLNSRLGASNQQFAQASFMQGSDEQRDVAEALQLVHSVVSVPSASTPTQWSVVRDHMRHKLYFQSTQNYVPRMIDLEQLDFTKSAARRMLPISSGDWFLDVTDNLQHQSKHARTMDLPPRSHTMQLQRLVASAASYRANLLANFDWTDLTPSITRMFLLGVIYGMFMFVGILAGRNVYRRYQTHVRHAAYQPINDAVPYGDNCV